MTFDPPDIPTDEDEVTNNVLEALMDDLAGWEPVEGSVETALAEEIGFQTQQTNLLALTVIELAVAGFGETGLGFPVYEGATAWIETQLTLTATALAAGTTVPTGFTVTGTTTGGATIAFTLAADVVVPPGTVGAVGAVFYAPTEGDYANGVPAGALQVATVNTDVTTVTAIAASTGGADAEEIADYLDRFTEFAATLHPGGVRASDLASLARSVPGVARALGVDLYDPANPGTPAERTATVFAVDDAGNAVSGAVAGQLQTVLAAAREVNFQLYVRGPQYTQAQVLYAAKCSTSSDPTAVQAAINTTVLAYLTAWGTTVDDDTAWVATNTVGYLDLAGLIRDVDGVAHLSTLTINGTAGDLAMTGVAAMPTRPTASSTPSTCTGTVAAAS